MQDHRCIHQWCEINLRNSFIRNGSTTDILRDLGDRIHLPVFNRNVPNPRRNLKPIRVHSLGAKHSVTSPNFSYALIYYVFVGIWINTFIDAVQMFVISSTAVIWYFKQDSAQAPVIKSIYRAFRFHMGSLAFGSLVLAIVLMIKYCVM